MWVKNTVFAAEKQPCQRGTARPLTKNGVSPEAGANAF